MKEEIKYDIGTHIIRAIYVDGATSVQKEMFELLVKNLIPKQPVLKEKMSLFHTRKCRTQHELKCEKYKSWQCPTCHNEVGELYIPTGQNKKKQNYCSKCGQKIDWGVKQSEEIEKDC